MAEQDTRVGERFPAAMRIKLKYADVETFIQKYAVNISRGGIFIATRTPKPVGTLVRFEFQLSTTTPVIRGEGQVIWVKAFDPDQPKRAHGMGVRFTRLDSDSRAIIDRALQWKKEHHEEDPYGEAPLPAGAIPAGLPFLPSGPERLETAVPEPLPLPEISGAQELAPAPQDSADVVFRASCTSAIADAPPGAGTVPVAGVPTVPVSATTSLGSTTSDGSVTPSGPTVLPDPAPPARSTEEEAAHREAVAELWQSSQSQIVRAARHIAELTAAHNYFPEDAALAELLKPLRVPLPGSGREASHLLEGML